MLTWFARPQHTFHAPLLAGAALELVPICETSSPQPRYCNGGRAFRRLAPSRAIPVYKRPSVAACILRQTAGSAQHHIRGSPPYRESILTEGRRCAKMHRGSPAPRRISFNETLYPVRAAIAQVSGADGGGDSQPRHQPLHCHSLHQR